MQLFAQIVSLAITVVAIFFTARAVMHIVKVLRLGQPAKRTNDPVARTINMLKETLGHTRMLQWHWIGIMHWFVFAAFLFLSSAVMAGYFQLFNPRFEIPVIGEFIVYEWVAEFLGLLGTLGILVLIIYRQVVSPDRLGRRSRFFGSTKWQAYFVEGMVLLESAAILFIRGAEYKLLHFPEKAPKVHFPLSHLVGEWFYPDNENALKTIVFTVAMIKIVSAMAWLIVISSNLTMGIAWHRFTAWFNIWFKREASGRTALGALAPMHVNGEPVKFDEIEDMDFDEDTVMGVGKIEDFTWKDRLDFTTCTECGRCQSQCPAWNTDKPLSPKLLMMGLRDHAYAKAGGDDQDRPLVGETEGEWAWDPTGGAVVDDDVLWSCTSCGACVQQCPVDIEHVDHIVDMRRYQVLVESNFPAELAGLFKRMEQKGNPWGMNPNDRLDWAKGLDVKVVGQDIESLDEVDWLFWVGCAGAYEDRAKKTTRAVAELLDMAGVSFAVLGNGETCTGDSARRAGNEFLFQGLATQNAETFKETKVKKVVSTCAHCFNTLKNEYAEFGVELEVVHHTQLLNRLVREKKLTPVASAAGDKRSITYHDPCYIGRHNQVYSPPRELLNVIPGAELKEMPRHAEKSFCCGAGGARMWMEENLGERININRTQEAVDTGADQIAVGCPFCRVMLSDGLTSIQSNGGARESVEVLDVAQMLLASVKGEAYQRKATTAEAPASSTEASGSNTEASASATEASSSNAEASASGSLFDDAPDTPAEKQAAAGGSLFDEAPAEPASGGSLFDTPATDEPAAASESSEIGSGSLFDTAPTEDAPAEKSPTADEPAAKSEPSEAAENADAAPEIGSGSLFDISDDQAPADVTPKESAAPEAKEDAAPEPPKESAAPAAEASAPAASTIPEGGSLFDIPEPEDAAPAPAPAAQEPEAGSEEPETAPEAEEPEATPEKAEPAPEAAAEPTESEPAAATEEAEPATNDVPKKGEQHQPKKDVDINESGSLFDL